MAGYADPGVSFEGWTAGCPSCGVAVSCRAIPDGVADLTTAAGSVDTDLDGSCRKLAWRGWELERSVWRRASRIRELTLRGLVRLRGPL